MTGKPLRIYLHCGLAKTGTSAIQMMLAQNVDVLAQHGIVYPEHSSLRAAAKGFITSGNGVPLAKLLGAPLPDGIKTEHIRDEINQLRAAEKSILYSSEAMALFRVDALQEFRSMITDMGYELRVITYVRSIIDHALSGYIETIKHALTQLAFSDWVRTNYSAEGAVLPLRNACKVLAPGEIIVRNYDRAENIYTDFLGCLDIAECLAFSMPNQRVNRSLNEHELALMRVIGPILKDGAQARVISDALIDRAPDAQPLRSVTRCALETVEARDGPAIEFVNGFLPDDPIGFRTERIVVSDAAEPELSPVEQLLAAGLAGIIRSGRITIRQD
jgi:hypothetical protein